MFKLIATAALVSLLAACSGMPTGSMSGSGHTMGSSGSMNGVYDSYGSGASGGSAGGPN